MPVIGPSRRLYKDYDCWRAWIEGGSLSRASKILYNKGVRSKDGGEPPSVSIGYAANRWAVEHIEQARSELIEAGYEHLSVEIEWQMYIIARAKRVHQTERKLYKWLLIHELLEPAKKLKLVPPDYAYPMRLRERDSETF